MIGVSPFIHLTEFEKLLQDVLGKKKMKQFTTSTDLMVFSTNLNQTPTTVAVNDVSVAMTKNQTLVSII